MSNDLTIKSQAVGRAMQRYQSVVDDFDREMARILGVNGTDVRCLELLITNSDDEVTPRDIAAHLNLTAGSVTTMPHRLPPRPDGGERHHDASPAQTRGLRPPSPPRERPPKGPRRGDPSGDRARLV